ncbi:MAG: sigma 54-interacting transcriptional regulator [Methylocystaceae bacterium]
MKISEVMTPDPLVLRTDQTIKDAALLFSQRRIDGTVVIDKHGIPVGMVTKSHIYRAIVNDLDTSVPLSMIMTNPIKSAHPDEDIDTLYGINVGRVPIVKNEEVVGIVTKSDITYHYSRQLKSLSNYLNTLMNSVNNAIISMDTEDNIIFYNQAACNILGWTEGLMIGRSFKGVLPGCDEDGSLPPSGQRIEYRGKTLLYQMTPVQLEGSAIGRVAVLQDVSTLENTMNELAYTRRLKEEMDAILQDSYSSVFVAAADGTVLRVNEAYSKLTGLKAEDLVGRNMYDLIAEGYYDRAAVTEVMESLDTVTYIQKYRTGKTLRVTGNPIFDSKGELARILISIEDVSELDDISQQLNYVRQREEEVNSIIEASFDSIFLTDAEGQVLSINSAYTRITGFTPKEIVGKNCRDLLREGFIDRSETLEVIATREPVTFTQKLKNGKTLLVTGNPIFNKKGDLSRVLTNGRDITELNRLRQEVEHAHSLKQHYENELKKFQAESSNSFVFTSQKMIDIFDMIIHLGKVDTTILIQGESGVGKEVIAQEIYKNSLRQDKPLIRINCAAIPESLLESELFGYEAGSFTGAKKEGKMGIFELADQATLFLDEIGELPLHLQAKLLRVLQEKEIVRIGSPKPISVDVRLITATNRDLREMVKNGEFRQDLYYRLNVVPITIPPLRERREDIPSLVNRFLNNFNKKYGFNKSVDTSVMDILINYSWPGNVRELRNVIERLVVTTPQTVISEVTINDAIRDQHGSNTGVYQRQIDLREMVAEYEKGIILDYVARYKSTRKTAVALGLSPTTLCRKASGYGISFSEEK